ncbi:MAG: tetratricopeptide repeat protein [Proteobacteria bacterium]|nr:tetratricopeptide repeat protein [Pseudomonadota bacterium]MBU4288530.1 tetratricopeptide repeat protein [Pseudomonadota bacterium]MCG2757932.1 tetratricopeptide repeat protein [Desulfobacteraceae bacterium]
MRTHTLIILIALFFLTNLVWAEESAEEWFTKGIKSVEEKNYEKAIYCFNKTIALYPDNVSSYSNLGYIYSIKEMWDEAIKAYKKGLAINPNDVRMHHDLGFSLYKKGMHDNAIEEFKKSIALDSRFAPSYHMLGTVYIEKKMFDQVIPILKKALKIEPDSPIIHCNLGQAYKETKKHILAADHYYQAGIIYLNNKNREAALLAYEDIISCSNEIAGIFLTKLYPDEKPSDIKTLSLSEEKDKWYILISKMNVRKSHSINSEIIGNLAEGSEFQIIKEAPNNTPLDSWYLIKTRSGFSGWLCGVYKGIVRYETLSKPNPDKPEKGRDL